MEDYKKTRYTLQGTTPPPPPHAHTHLYRKRDRLAQADRHHVRENGKAEAPRKEKYANTHIHNTCSRVELQPLHVLARTKRDLHPHILLHSPLFAPGGQSRLQHIHNTCNRVKLQPLHLLAHPERFPYTTSPITVFLTHTCRREMPEAPVYRSRSPLRVEW